MGQTYVYNLGSFDDSKDSSKLEIERGLFFDGTGNNHRNVEIRKKIKKVDEYADQTKPENRATFGEKFIYYTTLLDDSYKDDFSNVARLWRGVDQENYGIYIEGIGTEDKSWDNLYPGMALGEGITGIRAKVRKGCKKLADEIWNIVKKNENRKKLKTISMTIDVFGFSRGAAAARNFVYEVNGAKRQQDRKVTSEKEIIRVPVGGAVPALTRTEIHRDKDKFVVNPAYLDNGKMPKYGYLGYYLLENGLTKEELRKINLKIRFVGIYDTVASYGKEHDNDVEELQLNNLGTVQKVVHFTADDEHRKKFILTKINHDGVKFIEKAFPGVHSDIGGGYNTGQETIVEKNYSTDKEIQQERDSLISEYWYEPEELRVLPHPSDSPYTNSTLYYLQGTRKIPKEYSYIPLHFMEILFREVLLTKQDKIFQPSINMVKEYSITKHLSLIKAKNHLIGYVQGNEKKWEFIPDRVVEIKNTHSNNKRSFMYYPPEDENQTVLRELRHKYLHRSAKLNSIKDIIAHSPAKNRKRQTFPEE